MKKGERVFFGVCAVFFGFMFLQALGLMGKGRPGEIGSGLWPGIALGACILLSLARFLGSLWRGPKESDSPAHPAGESTVEKRKRRITVTLSALCFLAFMGLTPYLGFILATLLFIPAFAFFLGERRKTVLLVSPFLLTAIIVAVFVKFISIPFPKGVGIFASFSRLFY
ncbi:MAG: hypothetical protein AMJ94_10135 [Deltaproteobacteria bacterium SM23_61]|nr:MAG: hypothetical protein AMJ94_10135 [Deltaproteobacteria bacterium SM23_61]